MLNQFINLFWTFLAFMPVVWYWYLRDAGIVILIYVIVSVAVGFLPARFFAKLQLSKSRRAYERLGVRFIAQFVQDGSFSNRISGRKLISRSTIKDEKKLSSYLKTLSMYERYHMECLVFFMITVIDSLFQGLLVFSFILLVLNIIYNFYPIILQQYNRLRVKGIVV